MTIRQPMKFDMLGCNYYCLMRTNPNTFACFDSDQVLDHEPLSGVHVIEMTEDQALKAQEVLWNIRNDQDECSAWSGVLVFDGTMQELRDAVREWRSRHTETENGWEQQRA